MSHTTRPRRHRGVALGALALLFFTALPAGTAGAEGGVQVRATINDVPLEQATRNHPLAISPQGQTLVHIDVQNNTGHDITVRSVRVNGRVLGFEFFVFTTRVDLTLAPGAAGDRTFSADLIDLDGQAAGLMDGELALVGDDNSTLAHTGFTVDARGAFVSTYTLFGIAVALLTAFLLVAIVRRALKGTLPFNRWSRAARFAQPGAGLGMVLVFTLSAVRIVLVPAAVGFAIIAVGLAAGAAIGYLLPTEELEDERAGVIDLSAAVPASAPVPEFATES